MRPGACGSTAGAEAFLESLRGPFTCDPDRSPILDRWLAGAPNPDGEGRIPDITPGPEGIGDWSVEDIAYSLETGFTPEFDSFGGSMVAVQEHLALLPAEDREAIAAYLKAVPAR